MSSNDGSKFVCPSDRQLCLRAKLKTGWSAARCEPPLTTNERAAIADVVQRAEKLEEVEAKRIGRIVARLEGLRRVARGSMIRSCILCGDRGRLLSPLRSCAFCKGLACCKCVIEVHSNNRIQHLCNLCSETREMWKKSGAWFFKSMPKFILPERKPTSRYNDIKINASIQEMPCSSSAEGLVRSDSSDMGSRHCLYSAPPDFTRQTSSNESYKHQNETDDFETLHHAISALSLNRTESFGQKSSNGLKRTGSKGSAYSVKSYKKDIKASSPPPVEKAALPNSIPDTGLGTIEIKLNYDSSTQTLVCTVVRARGLPGMDMTGMADPFCTLEILPRDVTASNKLRTKTIMKSRNPDFQEKLNFYGITEAALQNKKLEIKILDDDKFGCDVMGASTICLKDYVKLNTTQTMRLALTADNDDNNLIPKPQILLSLSYNTKKRALIVIICKCINLPAMDSNGYSDPFIKLHLDPDPYHKKHKTSIKWRNLNPVYNEEFQFETRPTELSRQSLNLTIWDKDYGKADDFLGSLVLGAGSKGKRLKHWLDCIRFPDHRHEQWHVLTETRL